MSGLANGGRVVGRSRMPVEGGSGSGLRIGKRETTELYVRAEGSGSEWKTINNGQQGMKGDTHMLRAPCK